MVGGPGKFFQMRIVNIDYLRHKQKRSPPPGGVDFEIFQQEFMLAGGGDAALHGDTYFGGNIMPRAAHGGKGLGVGGKKLGHEFPLFPPEFLQNRTHQKTLGSKGVAAAVEAGFDAILGHPQPVLGKKPALYFS